MSGQGNDVPCCFSFQFYIKPQRPCKRVHLRGVVSHSNSTSNHNPAHMPLSTYRLFLIPILHQTTTLYSVRWKRLTLFLIPILHQTTTSSKECGIYLRCFSFQFYIKPQRSATNTCNMSVVSHSNSTSNHNFLESYMRGIKVVSHSNSTSNHNSRPAKFSSLFVVSHSNSTSNHNFDRGERHSRNVVSHSNSTSNHNKSFLGCSLIFVVSHSNSTSNHNLAHGSNSYSARYTYDTDA